MPVLIHAGRGIPALGEHALALADEFPAAKVDPRPRRRSRISGGSGRACRTLRMSSWTPRGGTPPISQRSSRSFRRPDPVRERRALRSAARRRADDAALWPPGRPHPAAGCDRSPASSSSASSPGRILDDLGAAPGRERLTSDLLVERRLQLRSSSASGAWWRAVRPRSRSRWRALRATCRTTTPTQPPWPRSRTPGRLRRPPAGARLAARVQLRRNPADPARPSCWRERPTCPAPGSTRRVGRLGSPERRGGGAVRIAVTSDGLGALVAGLFLVVTFAPSASELEAVAGDAAVVDEEVTSARRRA